MDLNQAEFKKRIYYLFFCSNRLSILVSYFKSVENSIAHRLCRNTSPNILLPSEIGTSIPNGASEKFPYMTLCFHTFD